jgi:copper homeostasis protein
MIVEVIVTNVEEAKLAEQYGAHRLELIHDFSLGGLSPNLELSEQVCAAVNIPVCVMLRPHGKSFIYDENDVKTIFQELEYLRCHTQAHGIVFGALTIDGNLDKILLEQVLQKKGNLSFTFHRAIDAAKDTLNCYKQLLKYEQIDRILTSGGKNTALDGMDIIKNMVLLSAVVEHGKVLAGSGITPDNAMKIVEYTGVNQIHLGSGLRTANKLDVKKFNDLLSPSRV